MEVKVNLVALVLVGLKRGEVCGLTLIIARGVGRAGDSTGHTDADFLTLHFCDRQNVNRLQKRG